MGTPRAKKRPLYGDKIGGTIIVDMMLNRLLQTTVSVNYTNKE